MSEFAFFGETYHLRPAEECGIAVLDFAEVASGGVDEHSLEGIAVVKTFLREVLAEGEFPAFWRTARKNRADIREHLMPVVMQVFRGETARPIGRPSDSSDGPAATAGNSEPDSSSPVTELPPVPQPSKLRAVARLEEAGRPDKALIVQMAADERASTASA